jgi:sugar phosphate isomerase/epimerase
MKLGLITGLVGDDLEQDWEGTLERLKQLGYEGVELSMGTLEKVGKSAAEARKSAEAHGMQVMSLFAGWGPFDTEAEKHIDCATELGCDYMVWGWSPANDPEQMKQVLPVMHKAASMVAAAGMKLLYHNHDHEFLAARDDGTSFDWLMKQFRPDLMQSELDIGWVAYGGQDVAETIRNYPDRCPILHMRDIGAPETRGEFIEVGEGSLDLEGIIKTGATTGASEWAVVEHGKKLPLEPWQGLQVAADNIKKAIDKL